MTEPEFLVLARQLVSENPGVAFRVRPGPRALRRRPACTVVCVDLGHHTADDMLEGLTAALRASERIQGV